MIDLGAPVDQTTCQNCGNDVTKQFARVFGDNDDIVHRCPECDSYRGMCDGRSAGIDTDEPYPEEDEGHHGNESDPADGGWRDRGQTTACALVFAAVGLSEGCGTTGGDRVMSDHENFLEGLTATAEQFEDENEDLEAVLSGDIGFHTFFVSEGDDATRGVQTAIYQGLLNLVDETDTSSSTVYRSIERFGSLIERVGRGTYDLADDVVREKIQDVFATLEDVTEWVEHDIDAIVDRSDEITQDSAIANWARRYGTIVSEHNDGLDVELVGQYDKVQLQEVLRAGLHAARRTGSNTAADFIDATVTFTLNGEEQEGQPF